MNQIVYQLIYGKPLSSIVTAIIACVFVWGFIAVVARKRNKRTRWKMVNFCLVVMFVVFIIYFTVLSRQANSLDIQLIPFHSFIEAQMQPELYRTMLMNVFLFVPLGLTLPFALIDGMRNKVLLSVFCAMVLSTTVEIMQYVFHLGRVETDDIICNTLGTAIGTLAFILDEIIDKVLLKNNKLNQR